MPTNAKARGLDHIKLVQKSGTPLHIQLRDEIRSILDTDFSEGDQFYSENQLTEKLGISRITVRRAIGDLCTEGRLVRYAGRGTIVSSRDNASSAPQPTTRERRADAASRLALRRVVRLFVSANDSGYESEYSNMMIHQLARFSGELSLAFEVSVVKEQSEAADAAKLIRNSAEEERLILFTGPLTQAIYAAATQRGYQALSLDSSSSGVLIPNVITDHRAAVRMGLEHLFDLGHQRILLLVNEPMRDLSVQEKIEEFFSVMRAKGFLKEARVTLCGTEYSQSSYQNAYEHMHDVWPDAESIRPTAIFTVSDPGGWAAMRWLSERGVKIPQDVSVIGFEGAQSSQFMSPSMSTVAHRIEVIAEQALKLLWQEKIDPQTTLIQPELIVRDSTGPPPVKE